ncbi:MAG: PhoH family protein [Calditrichaeota bacterium]|nr:PhoH family protein [Candidatus Cloacimonadota bacterium]MCB1045970.1 PhoH family protein [Calditrichota bacterium]MCB9473212.1 PhoH family protein [Candidatus Delongbacteria bacterium]
MQWIGDNLALGDLDAAVLLGPNDRHFKKLEAVFSVRLALRDGSVRLVEEGSRPELVRRCLLELCSLLRRRGTLGDEDIEMVLRLIAAEDNGPLDFESHSLLLTSPTGPVRTRTPGQERMYRAASRQLMTFSIGPAGTGKTFVAVAMAVAALQERKVNRIVLTRPAVEAGESLGFLPGDMKDKVDPYLRPLYDSLFDLLDNDRLQRMMERQIIEVAPLAFMRGRTLNNAFIILDEAQNTTAGQMKMFLTRLGQNSRAIITGDVTQTDLRAGQTSGLREIQQILDGVSGIEFVHMDKSDVVRHDLVRDIIQAYELHDRRASQ